MPFPTYPKVFPLVIDHTKVGSGTHNPFPLRVLLHDATLASRLRPDGRDLIVTDTDGSTALNYQRVDYASDLWSHAVWSWYPGARAYYDSTANAVFTIWVDYTDSWIGKYDLTAGTWTPTILRYNTGGDDHNHGCVAQASDRSVLSVPLIHNDPQISLYYSDGAASIASFTAVVIENSGTYVYNYPHIFFAADGTPHIVVRRAPAANEGYRDIVVFDCSDTSPPYTNWSGPQVILDASTSIHDYTYHKYAYDSASETFYAVGGLYPGSTGSHSLYAFKATWNGSAWTAAKLDGTSITLPMTVLTAGTLAYTEVGGEAPWIIDAAIKGGEVFALFETYPDPDTDHRLWCVRTASNVFGARESIGGAIGGSIMPGTASNYYGGGACFNPDDPDQALISNGGGGTFEMQRWTASVGVWTKAEDLTSYGISGRHNIRPYWIAGAPSGLKALWCEGVYTAYTAPNYDMQFMTYPRHVKPIVDLTISVPSLTNGADRTLYLYAGDWTASDQAVSAATAWGANTKIVCYGRNRRDDPAKVVNDITGNSALKALRTRPMRSTSPLFSQSQVFGDTSSVEFNVSDLNINSATGLTVESLAKGSDFAANRAIADNGFDASSAQYLLRVAATTRLIAGFVIGSDDASHGGASSTAFPTTGAHHVALVFDGANTKVSIALDGVLDQTASGAGLGTLKTSGTPSVPRWGTYTTPWVGTLEEHVVSTVTFSAGYLLTRTNNLTDPATFYALGAETPNAAPVTIFQTGSGPRALNRRIF